jgi:tetratricopeptide (TPR) repeat protein
MITTPNSIATAELPLYALAALGAADGATLAALVGQAQPLAPAALRALHPQAGERNGRFTLPDAVAHALLDELEQRDAAAYRDLHARALAYLAGQLRQGAAEVEPTFAAVFTRLADRLLLDDPARLAETVAAVRDAPHTAVATQHQIRYFEAVALRKLEQFDAALAAFDALLAAPDLDARVRGRALNSRAICYWLTGRLEAALDGYAESLALWRGLDDRLNIGKVLLNTGILRYQLHQYTMAEAHLQAAVGAFTAVHSPQWLAAAQNELGLVYRDQGRWEDALASFEQSLAQRRAEGAQDAMGRCLNNIGEVLLLQGRFDAALEMLHAALAQMTTRLYRVDAHLHLGLVHQARGDLAAARAAFEAALALAQAIGRRDVLAAVHYRLGDLLLRLDAPAEGLRQLALAVDVIEATRAPIADEGLRISLLGRWQQVYEALALHTLAQGDAAAAFAWAERARARAFAELVADADLPAIPTLDELQAALPGDGALLCYFTTGVLAQDAPMLAALARDNPLRDHLLTPARTLLFVVTRAGVQVHDCGLDPNTLATASPRGHDPARFLAPRVAAQMRARLLGPRALAGVRRVVIAPHGPLHHVPFGGLLDEAAGPLLSLAPSAAVWLRHCRRPQPEQARGGALVVGYPGGTSSPFLRFAAVETAAVAGLLGGTAWFGGGWTAGQARAAAAAQPILHFACHAWFNLEQPLDSYLEIGPQVHLTAREVLETWRLEAALVTLSACQTGVSHILRGDEPLGLVRAFLAAGARAALVTQWPVADLPTFLLMGQFYRLLRDVTPGDPAAALHAAQRWLRDLTAAEARRVLAVMAVSDVDLPEGERPFADPQHWAGFIMVG